MKKYINYTQVKDKLEVLKADFMERAESSRNSYKNYGYEVDKGDWKSCEGAAQLIGWFIREMDELEIIEI